MRESGLTGQDRISFLPDHLLCKILSDLPTKDAVRTNLLCKRWKSVWLSVPVFDLNISDFSDYSAFASVVHDFLDISRGTCIHDLRLVFARNKRDPSYMTQWIHNAITRKVRRLDILCRWDSIGEVVMPLSLYTCETLIYLNLSSVSLADFEYVSLPCLKVMHLEDNIYTNDALLEKLISSCPVLEDLTVVRTVEVENTVKVLRVRSQSLNSLILVLNDDENPDSEDDDWEIVIDAPGLSYLSLKDHLSRSFEISNLSSPAKVDIDVSFDAERSVLRNVSSKTSVVRKFLTRLSSVRDMTLSGKFFKVLSHYMRHKLLPQFPYMIHFYAFFYNSDLEKLPNFLESCPNLKSLVLDLEEFKKNELLILSSSIPKCLRSSLEYIEINSPISGAGAEMELVKDFLENSAVLKKFTLLLGCRRMVEELIIFRELLRFRRYSASCEVVVEVEGTSPAMLHRFL